MGLALDLEDCHPSVLLHCWLGHLTCKIVSRMTYNVSSGTLNPTIQCTFGSKLGVSQILDYFTAHFDGVHIFGCSSAESELIWMKSGALLSTLSGAGLGRFWASSAL